MAVWLGNGFKHLKRFQNIECSISIYAKLYLYFLVKKRVEQPVINFSDQQRAFDALCHSSHLYGRRLVLEWAETEETVEDLRKKTAENFSEGTIWKRKHLDIFFLNCVGLKCNTINDMPSCLNKRQSIHEPLFFFNHLIVSILYK